MTAPGPGPREIELTIDEVVLRGVPPGQAREVLARIEARLGELAGGWSAGSANPADLADRAESSRRLPPIDAPAASPAALGAAVADAVWREVGGGPARTGAGGRGGAR